MNEKNSGWFILIFFFMPIQEHLIENEVAVLRRVKHPNIIMLIEEVDTPSELCLVMELVKVHHPGSELQILNELLNMTL